MIDLDSLLKFYPAKLTDFKRNILAEYLQCKILEYIYSSEWGNTLVFMGGTAIRLCYESERFSEDIDFDNRGISKKEFKDLSDMLVFKIKLEGYEVRADVSFKRASRCFLRFPGIYYSYKLSPHPEERMLLQIDTEPQNFNYETETRIINRFGIFTRVKVATPSALLSMKIAALLGRKREKGRDFYDITFLSEFASPDFKYLKAKTGISSSSELKEKLLKKISGMDLKKAAAEIKPFLFSASDVERVLAFKEFIEQWKM